MTMPVAQAIVAGPSPFVTLSDVYAAPNAANTAVIFTVTTDQSVQLNFRAWDTDFPSVSINASEAAAAVGRRSFSLSLAALFADATGQNVGFEITSVTAPPPTLRAYQGTVRIAGARSVAKNNALPVRWNMFGGTPPAPAGGGGIGNWNQYTWAQYNPKGTTYPTP